MALIQLVSKSASSAFPQWTHDFCALPEKVRQGAARVGLIPGALWGQFLKQAPANASEFWLAYDGVTSVGRIGVNCTPERTGVIGFFEVDVAHPQADQIGDQLLATASEWLFAHHMTDAVGPMNFSTWFAYRFRVDDDKRAFAWEPQNPREYVTYFERAGFQPFETYHSVGSRGLDRFAEGTKAAYDKALSLGCTFRGWDAAAILEREVPILHRLSNEGFKDNLLFQPLPLEAFRQLYVPIANKFDFSYSFFCLNEKQEECGFTFCFVDGDALIIKSITVLNSERGKGLSNALTYLASAQALKRGINDYTSALMREGNRSESYSKRGETLWTHRYALYRRSFSPRS